MPSSCLECLPRSECWGRPLGTFSQVSGAAGERKGWRRGAQAFIGKWRKAIAQLIRKCREASPNFMVFLDLMMASNQACLLPCRCVQPPGPYGLGLHWASFFVKPGIL